MTKKVSGQTISAPTNISILLHLCKQPGEKTQAVTKHLLE